MVKVLVKCNVKKDQVAEFKAIAAEMTAPTLKEAGCLSYELFQDQNDSSVLFFVEEWESDQALTAHLNSPHVSELGPKLSGTLETPLELYKLDLVK